MWKNNNLSIVLFALFLICLVAHSIAGWKTYNDEQRQHGEEEVTYTAFLQTSEFGETVFENWESEFLQMAFYIVLTVFLYQHGSSESKKHDGTDEVEEEPEAHRSDPDAPSPVRRGGWRLALYKNSLSLAFILLFLISFIGHAAAGARKYNEEEKAHRSGEQVTAIGYMGKPQFWYESFQNWQSEFLAVFAIVVLSIWLRQWGSPESKPVHASHSDTGGG
jgi:succinate dehydrogenase hydrophobic anchor subunit